MKGPRPARGTADGESMCRAEKRERERGTISHGGHNSHICPNFLTSSNKKTSPVLSHYRVRAVQGFGPSGKKTVLPFFKNLN